ncbi:MAG TPA: hypothetical protein VF134_08920 [Candidatus Dormibacteraeota bacterium]
MAAVLGEPVESRLRRTVALLEARGYALPPLRLGAVCLGGRLSEGEVRAAVAVSAELRIASGLVVSPAFVSRSAACRQRALTHPAAAAAYLPQTLRFVERVVALCPFVLAVSVAGSLASGGFVESDDVDLNLIVADGRRHLAYVAVNLLAFLHALGRRGKPVDDSTRRPLAPRVMTLNLVLEDRACFPLARTDAQMALELLQSQPLFGAGCLQSVIAANPELGEHFPQLLEPRSELALEVRWRLPRRLFPRWLDGPCRLLGAAAWRWMQWTRRHRPAALARVAFVRQTMQPYALFEP